MPRKKVQPDENRDELEVQEGASGIETFQPEGTNGSALGDGTSVSTDDPDALDETSRILAALDGNASFDDSTPGEDSGEDVLTPPTAKGTRRRRTAAKADTASDPVPSAQKGAATTKGRSRPEGILTIDARDDISSVDNEEEVIWHEIRNAYRVRRPLTGTLSGVEDTIDKKTIAVLDYKGLRVVVPMKEMMIRLGRSPSGNEYVSLMKRQSQVLSTMLGAEVDFMVKGLDSKAKAVIASRKEAMLRKRKTFYLDTDAAGMPHIYVGRVVQARVIAVAEKVVRVEVFGVECSILARDLSWDWIGDARDRFSVGDKILVRIQEVNVESLEEITLRVDVRSVSNTTSRERLKLCRIEGKYAGTVTDVRRGVVYIRLNNGVNAVAHACYDYRMPGKKDDVSFAVTRIDEESGIAIGIITRIIKQNL